MRDVEPDHRRVHARGEDPLRRLGVGPDVEFGCRCAIALADGAAHQHDPLRYRIGVQREQQGDVRERPRRDQGQLAVASANLRGEKVDRVLIAGGDRRLRERGTVEARLPVHVRGDVAWAHERAFRPRVNGHLGTACELEDAEGVRRRLVEGLVPGDGRHAEKLDLG